FALTCPQDYNMMFKGESGTLAKVHAINCVPVGSTKIHIYKITPLSGRSFDNPPAKIFSAHCALTVCSRCQPIACPSTSRSSCPTFASADVDGSCASLTCPGDRFAISGGTPTVSKTECTASGWRIGAHENVTRVACAATVSCQDVTPLTCSDASCAVANGTLRCAHEGALVNTRNDERMVAPALSFNCESTTGVWNASMENGTVAPLAGAADFACRVYDAIVTGKRPWLKHVIAVSIVVIWISGGIGLGCLGDHIYGLGDNENPRWTPQLQALFDAEDAKIAAEEAKKRAELSKQNSSEPTTVTKPKTKKEKSDAATKRQPTSDKDTKTAIPTDVTPPPPPSLPRASSTQPQPSQPSSAEQDNQYEPIPDIETVPIVIVTAPPTAAAAAAAPASPLVPPSSDGYELLPQLPDGPIAPPATAPAAAAAAAAAAA
ncbi:hypothetical protein PENTCL1PPCAC_20879, partial [Pristionchus entomophagus]